MMALHAASDSFRKIGLKEDKHVFIMIFFENRRLRAHLTSRKPGAGKQLVPGTKILSDKY
jgi:hypothetical protein